MSFLLTCPNCGPRSAYEFRFGGEYNPRPSGPVSDAEWTDYVYLRRNVCGEQVEWWFHRLGCESWFIATRDTRTNEVISVHTEPAETSKPITPTPVEGAARV